MEQPAWVSEGSIRKYHRALADLTKANAVRKASGQPEVAITEAQVKELYVKWAGLVLGEEEAVAEEEVALEDMKVADLRKVAQDKGIETEGLTKAEILEALKAA